jgi:hypothetical protein
VSATLDRTVHMRLRHYLMVVNQSEGTAIVERWRCSGSTTVVASVNLPLLHLFQVSADVFNAFHYTDTHFNYFFKLCHIVIVHLWC